MRARTIEEFRAEAERLGLTLGPGREAEMHRAYCKLAQFAEHVRARLTTSDEPAHGFDAEGAAR